MPEADESDAETRRVCAILERVSDRFPKGSEEAAAIHAAAEAFLWMSLHHSVKSAYETWKTLDCDELSAATKQILTDNGIDPDE